MGYIDLSNSSEELEIFQLRLQAYLHAPEFTLMKPEALMWGPGDDAGLVLTAYDEGKQPVATISARVIPDLDSAEEIMECKWDTNTIEVKFPALLLGKGATLRNFHHQGVHTIIRYNIIKAAIKCQINTIMGIVFEHAPRTKLMEKIGYEFITPKQIWYTDLLPHTNTLIGVLVREKFAYAVSEIYKDFERSIKEYPIKQELLENRIKEMIGIHNNIEKF